MAANSVTILLRAARIRDWNEPDRKMYIHALQYAPGMDELDFNEWDELHQLLKNPNVEAKAIRRKVLVILYHQLGEWNRLEQPRTHEEWSQAWLAKHD